MQNKTSEKLARGEEPKLEQHAGCPLPKSRCRMVQLASLSSTAPITSLHVPFSSPSLPKPPALLAAGRASELVVLSLDRRSSSASSVQNQTWSWKVLERERVHRIISRELEDGAGWQLLLSGGKEAALVSLSYR